MMSGCITVHGIKPSLNLQIDMTSAHNKIQPSHSDVLKMAVTLVHHNVSNMILLCQLSELFQHFFSITSVILLLSVQANALHAYIWHNGRGAQRASTMGEGLKEQAQWGRGSKSMHNGGGLKEQGQWGRGLKSMHNGGGTHGTYTPCEVSGLGKDC